ncbi:MAG: hypothetical protein U5K74_13270 [Gemmatimonadaceae bacterium]|nr:hypothetical protein [Gemmatimonadaceae bacterium]
MSRFVVRCSALALVCAGSLSAQAAVAPKPPYEFVADFSLAASQGNQEVTTVSLGQRYSYTFATWKLSQTASAPGAARPTGCATPSCTKRGCVVTTTSRRS